jgi:hypothetical protein
MKQFLELLQRTFRGDTWLHMSVSRRFCAPRMGIWDLTMVRRGNNGPQVVYKYFKDLVCEHGLKEQHRSSKKDI